MPKYCPQWLFDCITAQCGIDYIEIGHGLSFISKKYADGLNEDYDGLSTPVTTVLSGFANPSFVIDGTPDASAVNGLTCSVSDFCVKFDVAQAGTFAGSVITNINSAGVTGSGVEFAPDLTLNFSQIQTPTDIMLMGGVTTIAASDLMSGRRLLIGNTATARFVNNISNENISQS